MPIYKQNAYESNLFPDPAFPLIFHCDTLRLHDEFMIHWQDNPEILYFIEGEAEVTSDTQHETCHTGDIAFFNCTHLHSVRPLSSVCRYYCLITDRDFLEQQGIPAGDVDICLKIADGMLHEIFEQVVREMLNRENYYKTAVKAQVLTLFSHLFRHYRQQGYTTPAQDKRLAMVKDAIRFIQENFTEELSIDQISSATGFSKYYFCRGFKEVTGRTVVEYLNFVRCTHARRLLASGRYNVGESAERSGFSNLSYFAKTYRRYMGVLPSQEEDHRA